MNYIQNVLSAPAKTKVMVRKGKKLVPLTRVTKSGQVKPVYEVNPTARIIKQIKHS